MNMEIPAAFLDRIRRQLGAETNAFLEAMSAPPVRGIRMNTLRAGADHPFRDAEARIPWCAAGWELAVESPAGSTIAHEAGAFYLQEPGAMIPAEVLQARPGEKILDLCAAPGGKSTQIGIAMGGAGLLIANEPVPKRAAVLSRNIERMGITNAIVISAWPEQLAEKWPGAFDAVMVDAPCSGEGMFRREPETRTEWSPEKAAGCVPRQRKILEAAAKLVRPGGRMVYATCTFNPAENEGQIRGFLEDHPEYTTETFLLPGIDGREGMYTCWPHRIRGEGQFICLMRRAGDAPAVLPDGSKDFRMDRETAGIWNEAGSGIPEANARIGQTLVRVTEIPDLKGIRVLRLGLHLAEIRGKILIPDHAAAVAGCPETPAGTELTTEEALRYLAGESLAGDAAGWTRMIHDGYVLGWGKGSGGQIKNHYPKGLRNSRLIG